MIKKTKYFLLIFFINYIYSCISVGGLYSPNLFSSNEVSNFKNTYIRFKINKLDNFESRKDETFHLDIRFRKKGFFYDSFLLINADYGYWRKYYSNFNELPSSISGINGDIRLNFLYGCEYKMPVGSDINRLVFLVNNESKFIFGRKEDEFTLPENHSIKLSFAQKIINRNLVSPIDSAFKKSSEQKHYLEEKKIYEITATVERNPEPDIDKPCEIPVTQ